MRPLELALHTRSAAFIWAAITAIAALAVAAGLPEDGLRVSIAGFWWLALCSLAVIATLVLRVGVWSAAGAYAAVFWCFHFGLIAVLAAGFVRPTDLSSWDQNWVFGPFAADAAIVALAASLALASGITLVHGLGSRNPDPASMHLRAPAHPHGTAGSVLVLTTAAIWCGIVLASSGTKGFFNSYSDYLQATADFGSGLGFVWLGLGCGVVLSVTGKPGWLRTGAIAAFCTVALLALPLGLRGEILFPSMAVLVASARCGRALPPGRAALLVLGLLALIPCVREIRNTGLQGLPGVVLELRLFDSFVEMGGSLHPVEKVVRWHAEGEPFELGSSYWAPIERAAARILPGLQTPAAEDDMRIMNVLVTDRVGAIGFSPVAEAYRNFGAFGVVIVLGALGALLASIDRLADRRTAVLAIATLYVPLLTNVRNSFISVPTQCLVGILFVVLLGAMRHVSSSVVCRPYARPPYVRSEI
ncbi:MAG TPA: O-antigen polysaccharide polymerase Wzy [Vicinamibacterales bacterium]|nr:O-antigen polysaccharide polymerase Wzy [Vicinamibacterales bacterium]